MPKSASSSPTKLLDWPWGISAQRSSHGETFVPTLNFIKDTMFRKGTVFLIGNGGSAANAIHIANDLISVGVRAHALLDVATLTMFANDFSYDEVFSRQLAVFGKQGDSLIALSGSGNSPNIIRGIQQAVNMKMETLAITGRFSSPNKAEAAAHDCIKMGLTMQEAEEWQIVHGHEIMLELKNE